MLDYVPELPNLNILRLNIDFNTVNGLLDLATMMNGCPNLENFVIKVLRLYQVNQHDLTAVCN